MQTAIITGSNGNLGQAVVEKMLAEGYRVIGTVEPRDKDSTPPANPNFEKMVVDLGSETETEKMIASVISTYKRIDVAVLTAGGFAMGKIADTTAGDLLQQYQLNFETAWHVARPVFKQMLQQQQGRIFLIGSRPGLNASSAKDMVAYGLSKSLLFYLATVMNEEARGINVVTSVIVPSTIDTAANRKSMPSADFTDWVKPADIAGIIHFYCSKEAEALREPVIKVYNNA